MKRTFLFHNNEWFIQDSYFTKDTTQHIYILCNSVRYTSVKVELFAEFIEITNFACDKMIGLIIFVTATSVKYEFFLHAWWKRAIFFLILRTSGQLFMKANCNCYNSHSGFNVSWHEWHDKKCYHATCRLLSEVSDKWLIAF